MRRFGLLILAACSSPSKTPAREPTSGPAQLKKVNITLGRPSGTLVEVAQPDGSLKITVDVRRTDAARTSMRS